MGKQKTTSQFIAEAKAIHGDKFDYSKVEYLRWDVKVCIICPIHGEFWQRPNDHLSGKGCFMCRVDKAKIGKRSFVERSQKIHGGKYDYSQVEYEHSQKKVKIICPTHGTFYQKPNCHLQGEGCPQCAKDIRRKTSEQFVCECRKVHGDKYDYSKTEYHQSFKKVIISCPVHGEFQQTPHHHLEGKGCPRCYKSKGETMIGSFLRDLGILFLDQYKVTIKSRERGRDDCLWIDFFLPKHNMAIEFNGIQHYEEVKHFHKTDNGFERQRARDEKLKKWCSENGIKLLEIKYDQVDDIANILINQINLTEHEGN